MSANTSVLSPNASPPDHNFDNDFSQRRPCDLLQAILNRPDNQAVSLHATVMHERPKSMELHLKQLENEILGNMISSRH